MVTNTISIPDTRRFDKLTVLSVGELLAKAVRLTLRTLKALAISTPCMMTRPSHTPWKLPWSMSTPKTSGAIAWPMSSPEYTTP